MQSHALKWIIANDREFKEINEHMVYDLRCDMGLLRASWHQWLHIWWTKKEISTFQGGQEFWVWQLDKKCYNAGLPYISLAFRCRVGEKLYIIVTAGAFEILILTKMSSEIIVVLTDERWAKFNLTVPFRLYVAKIQF